MSAFWCYELGLETHVLITWIVLVMASSAAHLLNALFDEGALVLDLPKQVALTKAGMTPTTSIQDADLAVAVDGGSGNIQFNSMLSEGLHVRVPTNWYICKLSNTV